MSSDYMEFRRRYIRVLLLLGSRSLCRLFAVGAWLFFSIDGRLLRCAREEEHVGLATSGLALPERCFPHDLLPVLRT